MTYRYLFLSGFNKDLESKINKDGADGWRLHTLHVSLGDGYWTAVMEKAEEDDGTKRS